MWTWTVNQSVLILKIFKNVKQKNKTEDLAEREMEPGCGAAEAAHICSVSLIYAGNLSSLEYCETF